MNRMIPALLSKARKFVAQNRFIFIFIVLSLSILRGLDSRWHLQQGDAAGFVDAMTDQSDTGDINFTYGFSVDALRKLFSLESSELNSDVFAFSREDKPFIHWHPYLFGFIVRLLPNLFHVEVIPLLLLATSYSLGLVLILRQISRSKISSLNKSALIILTLISPILIGAINGQPYFDKLFFGPCIAILFLLFCNRDSQRHRVQKLVIWLILSFTFSERISLMAALIVLGSLILFWKELELTTKQTLIIITTCLIGISWYIIWNEFISWNSDMQNTDFKYFMPNLRELLFGSRNENFQIFILSVLPMLTLTLLKFRYFIITLFTITPNLIVNIGGSELSGFSTHYHSVYLPVLIFFAALSVTAEEKKISQKKKSVAIVISLAIMGIGTYGNSRSEGNSVTQSIFRQQVSEAMDAFGLIPPDKIKQRISIQDEFEKLFEDLRKDTDKTVSAPEVFMPALTSLGFGSINYFPIGLGSDYLIVVPYTDDKFTKIEASFYGLVPIENRDTWSKVIIEELRRSYKVILNRSGSFGHVAIFERVL